MDKANVRGWCEAPLDMIVRLLQSLQYRMRVIATDQPPFEGAWGSYGNLHLAHIGFSCRRTQGPGAGARTWAVCNSPTARGRGRELSVATTLRQPGVASLDQEDDGGYLEHRQDISRTEQSISCTSCDPSDVTVGANLGDKLILEPDQGEIFDKDLS